MSSVSGDPAGRFRLRRRRLLLWSALPVLLALCLSAKLLSAGYLAGTAAQAFGARDGAEVASAASGLRAANFFETHKAPFAVGDGLVLTGDFTGARQRFEEALAQASPDDECIIRVNLALSIERLGDARLAAEDPTAAGRLFDEGLAVVDAAPDGCFPATSGSGDAAEGAGEKLEQAEQRLKQKSEEAKADNSGPEQPGADAGQPPPEPDAASPTQLEQLKDSARESQRQRSDGRERDEYLRDDDYGPGPDRPW